MKDSRYIFSVLFCIFSFWGSVRAANFAMEFDGFDDYISIAHSPSLLIGTNPVTIEFWFKAPNQAQFGTLVLKRQASGSFPNVGVYINDGTDPRYNPVPGKKLSFAFGYAAGTSNYRSISTLTDVVDGQYHHVAAVVDPTGQAIYLYIDGALAPVSNIATGSFPDMPITDRYVLGQNNGNQSFYLGLMDEVRIWNVARSQSQIQGSMSSELNGTQAGLVAYYKFDDDASVCDVVDCSTSENNGVRNGALGPNNLPQFSSDFPTLVDVACMGNSNCSTSVIPTLSTWSLIILGLLILNLAALKLWMPTLKRAG